MNWKGLLTAPGRNSLAGAAIATLLGWVFLVTPMGSGVTGLSYDLLFLFRGHVPVDGAVILYMDLDSTTRLHQKQRASWDRGLHAKLLDRLQAYQPQAVVFDVLFVSSPDEAAADAELVRAARASSNVIVAAKPVADVYEEDIVGWQLTLPFPELRAVTAWGVTEAVDSERTSRRHHSRADLKAPSIAWRAAEKTMAVPPPPFQARWMNYYGPAGRLPHYSYHSVFESNAVPVSALSNKVVFVGALYDVGFTGGRRSDDYVIPYTRWDEGRRSPGVEINATAYLNLLRRDWLRRLSPWVEVAMLAGSGLILGFGLVPIRPLLAAGLALLAFVTVAALAALSTWQTLVWFPWLIIGAIQIPFALGWSVLVHTQRLYREKRSLEQALAMANRGEPTPVMPASPEGQVTASIHEYLGSPSISVTPTLESRPWASSSEPHSLPVVPDHELIRRIGRGAYGDVYLARDAIGSYHAVKVVHRGNGHDPASLEREFNGIRNFTPISRSHPGFVHILHVGRNDAAGYIYCVMELGDDEASGQRINPENYSARNLAKEIKKQGRLSLAESLPLCIQLAEALEHLHRHNLIHRDIKPSNIIFVNGAPKFADIGLVTEVVAAGREATVVGTPGRMAPEGPGKPTADIYSLGKVFYEVGFGLEVSRFPELPTHFIEAADHSALFELNRIIMKTCDHDERRRYATAAEVRADLVALHQRVVDSSAGTPPPPRG